MFVSSTLHCFPWMPSYHPSSCRSPRSPPACSTERKRRHLTFLISVVIFGPLASLCACSAPFVGQMFQKPPPSTLLARVRKLNFITMATNFQTLSQGLITNAHPKAQTTTSTFPRFEDQAATFLAPDGKSPW